MTSTRKFLFETFVDPSTVLEEESLPQPAPLFTLQEKEEAYHHGYSAGYEQGEKESLEKEKSSREALIQELLNQIFSQLQLSFEEIENHKKNMIHQVVALVRQIFEKLFPILEKHFGVEQVKKLVQEVIESESPPALKITTHPQLHILLQEQFKKMSPPCVITFETNENFDLSNCRIEWQDSGIERAISQVVTEIETLLKGFENIFEESSKKQSKNKENDS